MGWKIFCTSVQKIEIENTEDVERRENLLNVFQEINPEMIISPAGLSDLSMLGYFCLPTPENAEVLEQLKDEIEREDQRLEAAGKKKRIKRTQTGYALNRGGDAMVLQGALSLGHDCIVVTGDRAMRTVCNNHSVRNTKPGTFLDSIMNKKGISRR